MTQQIEQAWVSFDGSAVLYDFISIELSFGRARIACCCLGRPFGNRNSENPGIAKKGSLTFLIFCVLKHIIFL